MLVPGTGTGGGVLYKKTVLQNLIKIAGRHLRWSLFFNKVAGLKPLTRASSLGSTASLVPIRST